MKIKYLKNSEINLIRWDHCINNAINGTVFAYSWYLNILCENWDALVSGDYEYVMPILHKTKQKKTISSSSKLGNKLGIFSNKLITQEIVDEFINNIPKGFSVIHLFLNKFNKSFNQNSHIKKTYELDLIQNYFKLAEKYSNQFQKNIHIAVSKQVSIIKGLMPNDLINFSKQKRVFTSPKLKNNDYQKLRMIMANAIRFNLGEIYGAYTKQNNLCAAAFFLKSKLKYYLIFNALDKNEQNAYPLHYLIDKFIESHDEKTVTLNIENIITINDPDFISGAGAHEYNYKEIYINHLPWYKKLLIKID